MGVDKTDFQIDENRLDEEWVAQPSLYFDYAAELADAKRDLDGAKNALELVKADAYKQINAGPENYGLKKSTEAAVAAAIATDDCCKGYAVEVAKAKYKVDVVQAAVAALDHRKKALENLVTLHLANYYSSPRAKGAAKEKMEEVGKRAARGKGVRKRTE